MPQIVEYPERPYLGIRKTVTMATFGVVADHIAGMIGWLAERGVPVTGAPFFRYDSIDLATDRLVVQAGVPVGAPVEPDGDMYADVLPAGRYVTTSHHGHPDRLSGVIDSMLKWADAQGLAWDMTRRDGTERWGCRLELYPTNPRERPDPHDWDIELQFRLA